MKPRLSTALLALVLSALLARSAEILRPKVVVVTMFEPGKDTGDTLSAETFWHGRLLNQWANDWVKYHTGGRGNYVTTAMEDTGTLQSLTWLARAGRADVQRVLVLRTASNFDGPPAGMTAAESLFGEKLTTCSAYGPSLESAYLVGSKVVRELVANWPRYEVAAPQKP